MSAWREFRKGKRNKPDVAEFEMNLEDNLLSLHEELISGIWQPSPYYSFYITDPKLRHINKAGVRDRVLHQAVFRVLNPIFDRCFIYDSYSSRTGKGTHRAVARLETFCRKASHNYRRQIFVLKCDIKKFFDSIDQQILKSLIALKVEDKKVLWLVGLIIGSFSKSPGKGLPLGNVTSQLFANIYLNELDEFIKHNLKVRYYIRYTDDFVIVAEQELYLRAILGALNQFSARYLQLEMHPNKIFIRKFTQGIDFLGYVVLPRHIVLRTKTKRRMFKKLFYKQSLLEQGLLEEQKFNQSLQSYLGIFKHCRGYELTTALKNLFVK